MSPPNFGAPLPPPLHAAPAIPSGLPAGAIIAFAGEVGALGAQLASYVLDIERWGWMLCDGRQLRIAQYPELFAALGFRYVQSGESTDLPSDPSAAATASFRIPDYRGYFLRGVDPEGAIDPDTSLRTSTSKATSNEVGSLQQHALQNHEHYFQQVSQATGGSGPPVAGVPTTDALTVKDPQPQDNASTFFTSKNETRPKNISVHYLIRISNGMGAFAAATLPPWLPLPGDRR